MKRITKIIQKHTANDACLITGQLNKLCSSPPQNVLSIKKNIYICFYFENTLPRLLIFLSAQQTLLFSKTKFILKTHCLKNFKASTIGPRIVNTVPSLSLLSGQPASDHSLKKVIFDIIFSSSIVSSLFILCVFRLDTQGCHFHPNENVGWCNQQYMYLAKCVTPNKKLCGKVWSSLTYFVSL